MREEMELTRHNVTPAQFCAYVRAQIRKHNFKAIDAGDIDIAYWRAGNDLNFYYHDVPEKPCRAEKSVSRPYEMQTFVLNWDGTVYNMIMEFTFDDDKTGTGYFYFVNDDEVKEEVKEEINTFVVTFEYSSGIYCTNLVLAANADLVRKHYEKYRIINVRCCADWELIEFKNKGIPVVKA